MRATVSFESDDSVDIIDQRLLPLREEILSVKDINEAFDAIKTLAVRGAPAIGVFAACTMAMVAQNIHGEKESFVSEYKRLSEYLNESRPTAVNLSWALNKMLDIVNGSDDISEIKKSLFKQARQILSDDIASCKKIGELGAPLIEDGYGVLTHCNAGALATIKYGTATAPMYIAHSKGISFRAYCDETRPLLQGARLSAYELTASGIDTTVLCDNMAASLMSAGLINIIFVGADRIAANGDVANKIGTSSLAINAKYYNIPFYVCAPKSTFDPHTKTGEDIIIEQRDPDEVTTAWYKEPMVPKAAKVYNPAFDITKRSLITGIITEDGIL